ncbi:hypothetical protein EUX98_g2706 [Antrodiella citrinella]|uniref:Uncharacterized protein n=1 Tax=Antrodiella citrinella TaxID=2447956 RepID=A0A4S4N0H7_9APHY|nr:hypothetical protein EUX98_g2706 [Antrodiella citrinella]
MPRAYDDEGDARGPWVFKVISDSDAVAQYNPGVVLGDESSIATQIPRLPPSSRLLDKAEIIPAMHTKSMLTHGIRVFATGMAVQETKATVYYGDHSGLMKSASFDFIRLHRRA